MSVDVDEHRTTWRRLLVACAGIAAFAFGSACVPPDFQCASDEECQTGDDEGICAAPGYCAFPDTACPSGFAYGKFAGPSLVGDCVAVDASTGQPQSSGSETVVDAGSLSSETNPTSTTSDGTGVTTGTTIATAGPGCPQGTPCQPTDPCATTGVCDAEGTCQPQTFIECDQPPGDCFRAVGSCNAVGSCEYESVDAGSACDDGDGCTVADACDGMGACVPGDVCPNDDPCQVATCEPEGCTLSAMPDGTQCGEQPADRCCGGTCVDIASDTDHCGGCNTACAEGLACESVAVTNTCDLAPETTSGRCRCQTSNAQCPLGQLCRTFPPFTNRCVTAGDENCSGVAVLQSSCPSYCAY